MICSDTMSRAALADNTTELTESDIKSQVHCILSSLPISSTKFQLIQNETSKDQDLQCVIKYINEGWPQTKSDTVGPAKPYFHVKNELTVTNNVIMTGSRLVIPSSLRNEMKKILHTGHLGIERTKLNARSALYWPGICNELTEMVSNCNSCQTYRNKQQKESLIPHEIPSAVWQKVGTDLFNFCNKTFLVVIDYVSKYFEVLQLPDSKSSTVINYTKSIFARHGIPKVVISDNGPQYSAYKYKEFATSWDFIHTTFSPEFSQSNGLVERTIQTIKKTLYKCTKQRI